VQNSLLLPMGGRRHSFGFIESSEKRRLKIRLGWGISGKSCCISDPSIEGVVRTLREDGVAVIAPRLKKEGVQDLLSWFVMQLTRRLMPSWTDHVPGTQTRIQLRDRYK